MRRATAERVLASEQVGRNCMRCNEWQVALTDSQRWLRMGCGGKELTLSA
jgi:hypothetical protein